MELLITLMNNIIDSYRHNTKGCEIYAPPTLSSGRIKMILTHLHFSENIYYLLMLITHVVYLIPSAGCPVPFETCPYVCLYLFSYVELNIQTEKILLDFYLYKTVPSTREKVVILRPIRQGFLDVVHALLILIISSNLPKVACKVGKIKIIFKIPTC